ncbi:MAG: extracellular solute-binding protein, partial [Bacilli bacterium]
IEATIKEYGFEVLFNPQLLKGAKIGMYNSSRDAFAAALLHLGYDINTTNTKELKEAQQLLSQVKYTLYGDDNLKKNVVTGNLDVALVYSGDYFDEYSVAIEEENTINFNYYAPDSTNYWLDGIVLSKKAQNKDLAYLFIDFIIQEDNALANTQYIGFASTQVSVLNKLKQDDEYDYMNDHPFFDPSIVTTLKPQAFHFISLEYMSLLEEMFAESKIRK